MKVAVAQPKLRLGERDWNLRKISEMTRSLARREVDLVCFPELATSGYALYDRWPKFAEKVPGPSTDSIGRAAKETGAYVVVGIPEKAESGAIHDSAVLVGPNGDVARVYRKVHLWDKERDYFRRGDGFPTFDTRYGRIGIGICYDIEFPESARSMALAGAKLLVFPSAEPKWMRHHIDAYAKTRAAENCVFVVFANMSGKEADLTYLGRSQITNPMCKVLASVASDYGAAVADVDLADLDDYKTRLPYLAQRVPRAYAP